MPRTFLFAIILIFSSCAHFKSQNIHNEKIEDLVSSLKGIGEGKGRLGVKQHQYLFSFDALLNENFDWILAANIPLHGEEILLIKNLKQETFTDAHSEGLQLRIERGIEETIGNRKEAGEMAKVFLLELRNIMRLVLHKQIGEEVRCSENNCTIGTNSYFVEVNQKVFSIRKVLTQDKEIEYVAQNLTDSIFKRGSIFFYDKKIPHSKKLLFSLELFWN